MKILEKDISMASQPLKKYLPLVIREMQFKPTVRYNQFTHIRKAKKKKKTNTQGAVVLVREQSLQHSLWFCQLVPGRRTAVLENSLPVS